MKRKITLSLFALMAAFHVSATDYTTLVFQMTDGTEVQFTASGLRMVPTDSEGLHVFPADGSNTFYQYSNLSKMYFSSTTTAIESAVTNADGEVSVYSLAGLAFGTFANVDAAKASLQPGVYVVKSGSKTSKIAVK